MSVMTPHFTSAIAAFGVVLFVYGSIVASELWFLYRKHLVEGSLKTQKPAEQDPRRKNKVLDIYRSLPWAPLTSAKRPPEG